MITVLGLYPIFFFEFKYYFINSALFCLVIKQKEKTYYSKLSERQVYGTKRR